MDPLLQQNQSEKSNVRYYAFFAAFVLVFGAGIFAGTTWQFQKQVTRAEDGSVTNTIVIDRAANHSNSVEFNEFWAVWDRIKQKYAKQPVSDTELLYGSIQGLVGSLGDPHSIFFPPKAAEEFSKDLSGQLEGIGAEIGMKDGRLVVISPLPESPAEKSGLLPGDFILKINNEDTFGMDTATAVSKIRGKAGTTVVLSVSRDKSGKMKEISIVRAAINIPSVTFAAKKGSIGYFKIAQFNQDTTAKFNQYVNALPANVKGVIIDLRNNPGGYLDVAVDVASKWIDTGDVIVSEKGLNNLHEEFKSNGEHPLGKIKTIVLVNKGSASASEIVAGALQDYKKATIVGEQSFGKGSVQDLEMFPDGPAFDRASWLFRPCGDFQCL
jgi:carboxyl-terminal processing protease